MGFECTFRRRLRPIPGQFKPINDANPTIGDVGKLEQVEEHRVEVLVNDEGEQVEIRGAVEELKKVCPLVASCVPIDIAAIIF